mmetsp:Transcript_125009/g.324741  ORF Transcript_125009/g.324741 Transcript_125009/m.324741 type:complete len:321 (-) Transcript_125009:31-993(-)
MSRPYGAIPSTSPLPAARYGGVVVSSGAPRKPTAAAAAAMRTEFPLAVAGLLVPWAMFTATVAVLSFTMHYRQPLLSWLIVLLGFCLVVVFGIIAYGAMRRRSASRSARDPTWSNFIFLAVAFAWVLGTVLGYINYAVYMRAYYDVASLETYLNVDPAKASGLQFMDGGRMVFTKDSHLDFKLSYGFKNDDLYCVAPITSIEGKLASYDFWAVGVNCCNGTSLGFTCGEAQNAFAHSGMRLLDDSNLKYFRLAIDQLQLRHGIQSIHPLFFEWTVDPITAVNNKQDVGFKNFLFEALSFFSLQLFLVILVYVGAFRLGAK